MQASHNPSRSGHACTDNNSCYALGPPHETQPVPRQPSLLCSTLSRNEGPTYALRCNFLKVQSGISIVLGTNTIDARTREGLVSARRHVALVATLVGVMFIATTLPTPLYVIYEHTFGFSRVTLTLVYAVYVVGNLVALLLLGRTSDIIGRRKVSLAAIAVAAVSTFFFLLATDTAWLFWARIFNGMAVGLTAGTATAWITELDPNQDRARPAVITTTSNFLGLAIGSLLAGVLAQYEPWPLRLTFAVYLALLAALAILIARTRETVIPRRGGLNALLTWPRLGGPSGFLRCVDSEHPCGESWRAQSCGRRICCRRVRDRSRHHHRAHPARGEPHRDVGWPCVASTRACPVGCRAGGPICASPAFRNCRERHILRAGLSRQPASRKRNRSVRPARGDGLDLFRRRVCRQCAIGNRRGCYFELCLAADCKHRFRRHDRGVRRGRTDYRQAIPAQADGQVSRPILRVQW
jgi:hypothetical protein